MRKPARICTNISLFAREIQGIRHSRRGQTKSELPATQHSPAQMEFSCCIISKRYKRSPTSLCTYICYLIIVLHSCRGKNEGCVFVFVPARQLLDLLTDFHETRYEFYSTRGHSKAIFITSHKH